VFDAIPPRIITPTMNKTEGGRGRLPTDVPHPADPQLQDLIFESRNPEKVTQMFEFRADSVDNVACRIVRGTMNT
jgi:hypothetical protein